MQVQVTSIQFDFDDDIHENDQKKITSSVIGQIYDLYMEPYEDNFDDEDVANELMECVCADTGWAISSIDYRHILK